MGTGIALLPMILLAALGYSLFQDTLDSFDRVVNRTRQQMLAITDLQRLILRAPVPASDYLIHGRAEERDSFEQLSAKIDQAFAHALEVSAARPEVRALIDSAREQWQQARHDSRAVLMLPEATQPSEAADQMERMDVQFDSMAAALGEAAILIQREVENTHALAHARKHQVQLLIAVMFGIGLLTAIVAAIILTRSILIPLRALQEGARRLGNGDLGYRMPALRRDELGELAQVFNDMAQMLEENQRMLKYQASRDGLTGLYNKREFHLRLSQEAVRATRYRHPVSLMMLDLDHFKNINDTYGHPAGDKALRNTAIRLAVELRPTDVAARYGGEEFAVVLPETAAADALRIAERIRAHVENDAIRIDEDQSIHLTISIGVASLPDNAATESDLMQRADAALYAAKAGGRNRVCMAGAHD